MSYPYKAQLKVLGVERVRNGMRAFTEGCSHSCGGNCFLGFAFAPKGAERHERKEAYIDNGCLKHGHPMAAIEEAFEGGWGTQPDLKDELRQSCLLFLAEHGEAVEPSPLVAKAV